MRAARIVIQSRLSSSRLPAKALLPISGLPSVVLAAKRAATSGVPVVVATSETVTDDLLTAEFEKHSISHIRGSLDNVLKRFVQARSLLLSEK